MTIAPARQWNAVTEKAFELAHRIVTASAAGTVLDDAAKAAAGPGGPKRRLPQYSGDAVLTGLLLLAMAPAPMTIANLIRLLWTEIDDSMRARLGLHGPGAAGLKLAVLTSGGRRREYERLRNAIDRLVAPFDPSPHPRQVKEKNGDRKARERRLGPAGKAELAARRTGLLALCNLIIGASLPARPAHYDGSVAVDEVLVEANAKTGGTGRRPGLRGSADPDAGWWFHKPKKRFLWGYGITFAVATHPLYGREVPCVVTGMSISVPTGGRPEYAMEALDATYVNGWGPRPSRNNIRKQPMFVADMGFTHKNGLAAELVRRGYAVAMEYPRDSNKRLPAPVQHECEQGPVQYNGTILCPAALALAVPSADPATGQVDAHPGGVYDEHYSQVRLVHPGEPDETDPAALAAHRALQDLLLAHAMPRNGRLMHRARGGRRGRPSKAKDEPAPEPTHSVQVICPARAGQLRCPHDPDSLGLPLTVPAAHTPPEPDENGNLPTCCSTTTYTTVHLPDPVLKKHQEFMAGTDEHADRYGGSRSRNEQLHSQLKDRNASAFDDDCFELTGTARVALLTALAAAATNLKQSAAYDETVFRNGGKPPYEDRVETQRLRDRILRAHHNRRRGKDTTR